MHRDFRKEGLLFLEHTSHYDCLFPIPIRDLSILRKRLSALLWWPLPLRNIFSRTFPYFIFTYCQKQMSHTSLTCCIPVICERHSRLSKLGLSYNRALIRWADTENFIKWGYIFTTHYQWSASSASWVLALTKIQEQELLVVIFPTYSMHLYTHRMELLMKPLVNAVTRIAENWDVSGHEYFHNF